MKKAGEGRGADHQRAEEEGGHEEDAERGEDEIDGMCPTPTGDQRRVGSA